MNTLFDSDSDDATIPVKKQVKDEPKANPKPIPEQKMETQKVVPISNPLFDDDDTTAPTEAETESKVNEQPHEIKVESKVNSIY